MGGPFSKSPTTRRLAEDLHKLDACATLIGSDEPNRWSSRVQSGLVRSRTAPRDLHQMAGEPEVRGPKRCHTSVPAELCGLGDAVSSDEGEKEEHREFSACVPGVNKVFGVSKGPQVRFGFGHMRESQIPFGVGVSYIKGRNTGYPNQDSWSVLQSGGLTALATFDGHGDTGHMVSDFARGHVMGRLVEGIHDSAMQRTSTGYTCTSELLTHTFNSAQREITSEKNKVNLGAFVSGSTATVALVSLGFQPTLTVGHVGDSLVVLGKRGRDGRLRAVKLTPEHRPDLPTERQRIEDRGGVIVQDDGDEARVSVRGTGHLLAMSRSLGDISASRIGVSAKPDVTSHDLTADDAVVICCSDGVWTMLTPQEAVDIVAPFLEKGAAQAMAAAQALTHCARTRWLQIGDTTDDISALIHVLP